MRKWSRRIFWTIWSLLLLAIPTIWIRSYWYADEIGYKQVASQTDANGLERVNECSILISDGRVGFVSFFSNDYVFQKDDIVRPRPKGWFHNNRQPFNSDPDLYYQYTHPKILGFGAFEQHYHPRSPIFSDLYILFLPLWSLLLPLAIPPALIFRRHRRRKLRLRRGQCTACGYDLRESKDLCPECGQPRQLTQAPTSPQPATPE